MHAYNILQSQTFSPFVCTNQQFLNKLCDVIICDTRKTFYISLYSYIACMKVKLTLIFVSCVSQIAPNDKQKGKSQTKHGYHCFQNTVLR